MRCYILFFLFAVKIAVGAPVTDCDVVPMPQWSGATSRRQDPLPVPLGLVVIQHTVYKDCTTDADCETIVKGIQKYQVEKRGFTDIGYSFLIGGNGKVYEGAGWSLLGAHTLGYNNRSIGIAFIGDFRNKLPSPEALKAAADLLSCGVQNKHLSENYHLVGHRQLSLTESPGGVLQSHIETWPHWLEKAKELSLELGSE